MKEKVRKRILEEQTAAHSRPTIKLGLSDFISFLQEVEADYVARYSGLICDESSSSDGKESIVYMGCPIVLDLNAEPLI